MSIKLCNEHNINHEDRRNCFRMIFMDFVTAGIFYNAKAVANAEQAYKVNEYLR